MGFLYSFGIYAGYKSIRGLESEIKGWVAFFLILTFTNLMTKNKFHPEVA